MRYLALWSAMVLITGGLFAQAPAETEQTTKKTTATATTKTQLHSASGTVKDYAEGKSIVVTNAKGKDVTFDLSGDNLTAKVAPGVAIGSKVKVIEKTDNAGKKMVTVSMPTKHKKASSGA